MNETKSTNTVWHHAVIKRENREKMNGHKSIVIWFTGLSGSGKSTIALKPFPMISILRHS